MVYISQVFSVVKRPTTMRISLKIHDLRLQELILLIRDCFKKLSLFHIGFNYYKFKQ